MCLCGSLLVRMRAGFGFAAILLIQGDGGCEAEDVRGEAEGLGVFSVVERRASAKDSFMLALHFS